MIAALLFVFTMRLIYFYRKRQELFERLRQSILIFVLWSNSVFRCTALRIRSEIWLHVRQIAPVFPVFQDNE